MSGQFSPVSQNNNIIQGNVSSASVNIEFKDVSVSAVVEKTACARYNFFCKHAHL